MIQARLQHLRGPAVVFGGAHDNDDVSRTGLIRGRLLLNFACDVEKVA